MTQQHPAPSPVAVLGANGRMGAEAVKAVEAAADMTLVAALGRGDSLDQLASAGAEFVVDLTVPESTEANVRYAVEHGMHAVVGTTGWDSARLAALEALLAQHPETGVLIAPNFALGSVLASAFAAKASKYFESVEIIELHHPDKVMRPPELPSAPPSSSLPSGQLRRFRPALTQPPANSPVPGVATLTVCASTVSGFAGSWPTRKSCSAGRGSS